MRQFKLALKSHSLACGRRPGRTEVITRLNSMKPDGCVSLQVKKALVPPPLRLAVAPDVRPEPEAPDLHLPVTLDFVSLTPSPKCSSRYARATNPVKLTL